MQSSVALTNTYLYQSTYRPYYFNEFIQVSALAAESVNVTFYGVDSPWTNYFNRINGQIYSNYKDQSCYSVRAVELNRQYCSFSNLTYNQWLDNTILANPLPGLEGSTDGYVDYYGEYATGWITPEYGFWRAYNDLETLAEADYLSAIDQTYQAFNISGLFNGKKYQDVLLFPD